MWPPTNQYILVLANLGPPGKMTIKPERDSWQSSRDLQENPWRLLQWWFVSSWACPLQLYLTLSHVFSSLAKSLPSIIQLLTGYLHQRVKGHSEHRKDKSQRLTSAGCSDVEICYKNRQISINAVALHFTRLVVGWVYLWAGKLSHYVTSHPGQLSHPSLRGR